MKEHLKSGREALRLIYFLIISLAITKSLEILFTINGKFGWPETENILFFIIFQSFITRFFLGAYRILSKDIELEPGHPKIFIDTIFFYLQALCFYVFSLNFEKIIHSQSMIFLICFFDAIWLCILLYKKMKEETFNQWMVHNLFFLVFCPLNYFLFYDNLLALVLLFIFSIIFFFYDFAKNKNFYLFRTNQSLRIFVAGPYGDNEHPEIIEKNIEQACKIGKELALKGHFPFVPHTMLQGWEKDSRFKKDTFINIDNAWLDFCDALYFIAPSEGANFEKELAIRKGLKIFTSLDKVPIVSNNK